MLKRILFLFALAFMASPLVFAQITTSSISGAVKGPGDDPLVGANVVATHQPTGTKYATSTRGGGQFIIANMRPGGPYSIEITFIGYRVEKLDNIFLQLAESFVLMPTLTKTDATLENVMYVVDGGWSVAVLRMFTAVPAHASFAVLMGYYLGLSKFVHHKSHYGWYGLGIATLFHGAYDYFWFIAQVNGVWAGIWLGALVSLVIGIQLSRKAIKIHQEASPFQYQAAVADVLADPKIEDKIQPDPNPESEDRYLK